MSIDDHTGADVPAHVGGTDSPSTARADADNLTRETPRRRGRVLIIITVVMAMMIAGIVLARTFLPARHDNPRHANASHVWADSSPVGYHGDATDTHTLSSAWSSGIAVAWKLPIGQWTSSLSPRLVTDGTTVYVLVYGLEGAAPSSATIMAYDVSGTDPRELWRTSGPQAAAIRATPNPASLTTDTQLLIDGLVVDKATGAQSHAPWGEALPIGVVDGIVVTCDTRESCSGWMEQDGQWTQQWTTTTSPQRHEGMRTSDITHPTDGVLTANGLSSVLVPVDDDHYTPQIVDPYTGELTTLGDWPPKSERDDPRIIVASDGVVIVEDFHTVSAYDASGAFVETYEAKYIDVPPTDDGHMPSLKEIKAYASKDMPVWTTGKIDIQFDHEYEEYCLAAHPTGATYYPVVHPRGVSYFHEADEDSVVPTYSRMSADASALFVTGRGESRTTVHFFDITNSTTYESEELNNSQTLAWAFDDLLIGVTGDSVVAFTPVSG